MAELFKVPVNGNEPGFNESRENLQMMFMSRFCKFPQQNRELSFARSEGASRSCQANVGRRWSPDKWAEVYLSS